MQITPSRLCPVYADKFTPFKSDGTAHTLVGIQANSVAKDQPSEVKNAIMSDLKHYLSGIHHAIRLDNIVHYLATFAWQLNNRYDVKQAFRGRLNCIKTKRP